MRGGRCKREGNVQRPTTRRGLLQLNYMDLYIGFNNISTGTSCDYAQRIGQSVVISARASFYTDRLTRSDESTSTHNVTSCSVSATFCNVHSDYNDVVFLCNYTPTYTYKGGWLGSRVVSVLDSSAEGPGFKSQPRRCQVTVLGKLFTPIELLFTKQQNR